MKTINRIKSAKQSVLFIGFGVAMLTLIVTLASCGVINE